MCQLLFMAFRGQCNLHSSAPWAEEGKKKQKKLLDVLNHLIIIAAESVTADPI